MLDIMTQIEILKKKIFRRQKQSSWVAPLECRRRQVSAFII